MNRRIMMIDELYSFCLQNKFTNFDSKEYGKELVVKMPGNFEKSENEADRLTEGLTPFLSRAFHDNVNLNRSCIEEEDFRNNVPSSHLRPILAHVIKNEDTGELDFGSHDCHVETITQIGDDGKEYTVEKTVYDERPIGVIDGSKTTIEYDEDAKVNRAVLHGFLYNEYCQDAIDILNRRGTVNCSVELIIRQLSFDAARGVLVLNDFYVSGLTLLGEGIKPGMAGSDFKIEDFSINDDYLKFTNQLNEMQAKLNELEARFSINSNSNDSMKGGIGKSMNKFEMLLAKYNKTAEDVTFEYENLSDEELEAAFEKAFANADDDDDKENKEDNACGSGTKKKKKCEEDDDDKKDPDDDDDDESKKDNACGGGSGSKKKKKKCEEDDDEKDPEDDPEVKDDNACGTKKKKKCDANTIEFSVVKDGVTRTFEISLQDRISTIHSLVNETYADADNTYYGVTVFESHVIMEDWWSGRYFKQSYTFENDVCALVGDRVEVYAEFVTASEQKELEDMRSNYAALKEFKETTEKNELHAQREEIINSENFAVISEKDESGKYVNEAFAKLVSEMDNYSLTDLEKEAKVILADFVTSKNFALEVKPEKKTSKKQFSNPEKKDSNKPSRYGKLFAKEN